MKNTSAYKTGARPGDYSVRMTHDGLDRLQAGAIFDEAAFTPAEMEIVKQQYRFQRGTVNQVGPHLGRGLVRIMGRREVK